MQIYLVGGAVRDQLLGYPVYDKDWVVVGATVDEMLQQGFQPVGSDFPVFIHPDTGEEYALARTERKSGKGYTGFQYHASSDVTLEQDLIRRDLSINAMAMDDQGQLHDPYNGQADLQQKLLRHVSPAFIEDPLRVLRVARFASRYHHLGFRVADETLALMTQLATGDELLHLTPERIWKECERALGEQSPELFFGLLQQIQALDKVLPELANCINTNTLDCFKTLCSTVTTPLLRFACLLSLCATEHDLNTDALCERLRTPKAFKELAQHCQQQHSALAQFDILSATEKLNIIQSLDLIRRPQRIEPLIACCEALHGQIQAQSLPLILTQCAALSPQSLIQAGFKGAELGAELARQRLSICQGYSI